MKPLAAMEIGPVFNVGKAAFTVFNAAFYGAEAARARRMGLPGTLNALRPLAAIETGPVFNVGKAAFTVFNVAFSGAEADGHREWASREH